MRQIHFIKRSVSKRFFKFTCTCRSMYTRFYNTFSDPLYKIQKRNCRKAWMGGMMANMLKSPMNLILESKLMLNQMSFKWHWIIVKCHTHSAFPACIDTADVIIYRTPHHVTVLRLEKVKWHAAGILTFSNFLQIIKLIICRTQPWKRSVSLPASDLILKCRSNKALLVIVEKSREEIGSCRGGSFT